MGSALLSALAALSIHTATPTLPDSIPTFATPATRALVERGIARRHQADTSVTDYIAQLTYRLSVSGGPRRWARLVPLAAEEQVLRAHWQAPNDLRIDVLGRRSTSRPGIGRLSSTFDHPWFVPRSVGDSMRIVSDEVPAVGALHPLAESGPEWYRYELVDSLGVITPRGQHLQLYGIEITPKRAGPSLVTGRIWLDAATAEVVRFTFRYVGTSLWARPGEEGMDSSSARRVNAIANRIVTLDADLEYGLEDSRYWMPYRQVIAGTVQIPVVKTTFGFRAVTTFDDYQINTGTPVAFLMPVRDSAAEDSSRVALRDSLRQERRSVRGGADPDSLRERHVAADWPGGRFEINRPSDAALDRYQGWTDSLTLGSSPETDRQVREMQAELAGLSEHLPRSLTGARPAAVAYERLSDVLRYDRVQGLSLGAGGRIEVPGVSFTDLYGTVRYGFSDHRVTGRVSLVRDAPGGRLALRGYRDIRPVDPFAPAPSFGASLDALFTAHDDADYLLAAGGEAEYLIPVSTGTDLTIAARAERESSAARRAHSSVNDWLGGDGLFPANPPVAEGTFGALSLRMTGVRPFGWMLGADALTGSGTHGGRIYGSLARKAGGMRGATVRLKAGIATDTPLPQLQFRLGGEETVRGFPYGYAGGNAFWSAQLDVTPFRRTIQPVLFIDAGQASRPGTLFQSKALVGAGVGVTMYSPLFQTSLIRFDLSWGVSPDLGGKPRFDVIFQAPR